MRSFVAVCALLVTIAAAGAAPVFAAGPSPAKPAGPPDRILGMIPVHDQAKPARPTKTSNLTYHGGPVMTQNHVFSIFWSGGHTWDANYKEKINQYLGDVAADSVTHQQSNVYWSDTQYSGIKYDVRFSKATDTYNDDADFPPNGCTDKATKICLSDDQLQAEIQRVMVLNGWSARDADNVPNLFLMFTPQGVGSCAGSSCAYTNYCAYHSWIGSGSNAIMYANQPYAVQNFRIYTCDSGQRPNGATADATINLISHEHNEAITDPQGTGWWDSRGYENGDKCAWNFGTSSGPSGAKYNQTINTHNYYLQQEWSNQSSGCVLTGL